MSEKLIDSVSVARDRATDARGRTVDTGRVHLYEMTSVSVTGDHFPLITQLGAIDLARDALLRPEEDS